MKRVGKIKILGVTALMLINTSSIVLAGNTSTESNKNVPYLTSTVEEEPNNTMASANAIGPNRWKRGYITIEDPSDDFFVYRHKHNSYRDKLSFDISNTGGAHLGLYVYDSSGREIGRSTGNNSQHYVSVPLPESGNYYIKISKLGTRYPSPSYRMGTNIIK